MAVSINISFAGNAFNIYMDNDSRYLKPNGNTDRHYTSGVKLVYVPETCPKWNWLDYIGGWCFGDDEKIEKTNLGYFMGQNIYTPDYADEPQNRYPKDMKYAGWLYGGFFVQRASENKLEHTELNLGVIGPSAKGKEAQDGIHDIIGSTESIGWEDQLGDEFAADFLYNIRQKIEIPALYLRNTDNFDTAVEYGGTLGTVHRHVEFGFLFRYGWHLIGDFGPGRLEMPVSPYFTNRENKDIFYVFTRLSARVVEYNRFLTGLDDQTLVGRAQIGIAWRINKSCEIGYSQTFLTSEFKEQHGNDRLGALTVLMMF